MLKKLIAVSCLSVSVQSFAATELLSCSQTEPFITYEFNSKTKLVKVESIDYVSDSSDNIIEVYEAAFVKHPTDKKTYQLVNKNKEVIIDNIIGDMEGDDGMSGYYYPLSATVNDQSVGCETTSLKAKEDEVVSYSDMAVAFSLLRLRLGF